MPKDPKKKKSKGTTTTTGSKDNRRAKVAHHQRKRSKQHKKSRQQQQQHRRRLPQLPPAQDENLEGIVLVKDRNKKEKQHLLKRMAEVGPTAGSVPSKESLPLAAKMPSTPGPAYRSMENVNAYRSVEPLTTGVKKQSSQENLNVPVPQSPLPMVAAGDGGQNKTSDRSREQVVPAREDKLPLMRKKSDPAAVLLSSPQVVDEPKGVLKIDEMMEEKAPPKDKKKDLTRREEPAGEKKSSEGSLTKEERLRKWRSYADRLLDGGQETIAKEFRQLKGYLPTAATRSVFDANPQDNRFEDIVCVDHTRVVVEQKKYLHASWVDVDKEKQQRMILTQLPLPHTASTFWQMVLETGAQGILLLLTNYEYDMFNAEATFPEQQDFLHYRDRHIRVGEFKRVKVASHWTMHVLSITDGDKKRFLHLHHYANWAHGQQLNDYMDLWRMQSTFRRYAGPHIVMSLSGCGRAGTYAALEVAHARLHSDSFEKLYVVDAVQRVRDGRMHAVQRLSQLKTVHLALLHHVLNNGFMKDLPSRHKDAWEELQKDD